MVFLLLEKYTHGCNLSREIYGKWLLATYGNSFFQTIMADDAARSIFIRTTISSL